MCVRKPIVAGQFYPAGTDQCLEGVLECVNAGKIGIELPEKITAGIVPHAGWTFSGDLAAMVFSAIKQVQGDVDTFVIFGAVHRYAGSYGTVFDRGNWISPLGAIDIDEELAGAIVDSTCAKADRDSHGGEHSIEVQVPFIQHLFSKAKIVPVMVPPAKPAVELGSQVGEIIAGVEGKTIVCIASTDLTHYGPRYGFCPEGAGLEALGWAKDVNDMQFINLALNMDAERLLMSAEENCSACGAGAAAAAVGVAKRAGVGQGILLAHTHSCEVMQRKFDQASEESVGYAAIVF